MVDLDLEPSEDFGGQILCSFSSLPFFLDLGLSSETRFKHHFLWETVLVPKLLLSHCACSALVLTGLE